MKYLKLKYPNHTIHNIMVKEFGVNENKYFIAYYDLTEHKEKFSLITKENDTYQQTKIITKNELLKLQSNYNKLNPHILPKEIKCLENEDSSNTIEKNSKELTFIVYNDATNLYIDEYIAKLFKINNINNSFTINNTKYVQVQQNDIENIEKITQHLNTKLKAKYIKK